MKSITKYNYIRVNGKVRKAATVIAEKALGKPLPKNAEVHHIDGNGKNDSPDNLVICPSPEYHRLLHIRTDALEACGNPNFRKCIYCKQYSDIKEMYFRRGAPSGQAYHHNNCHSAYQRQRKLQLRVQNAL